MVQGGTWAGGGQETNVGVGKVKPQVWWGSRAGRVGGLGWWRQEQEHWGMHWGGPGQSGGRVHVWAGATKAAEAVPAADLERCAAAGGKSGVHGLRWGLGGWGHGRGAA